MACAPAMDEFDQASVKALAQSNQSFSGLVNCSPGGTGTRAFQKEACRHGLPSIHFFNTCNVDKQCVPQSKWKRAKKMYYSWTRPCAKESHVSDPKCDVSTHISALVDLAESLLNCGVRVFSDVP